MIHCSCQQYLQQPPSAFAPLLHLCIHQTPSHDSWNLLLRHQWPCPPFLRVSFHHQGPQTPAGEGSIGPDHQYSPLCLNHAILDTGEGWMSSGCSICSVHSLMNLRGTVDYWWVVDEFCYPISFPFACTTDYHILWHSCCLQRVLGFQFHIIIIGIWFTIWTSVWNSSWSIFNPPPAHIIILIYCISTPYTIFSLIFSIFSVSFFFNHITVYSSPICILFFCFFFGFNIIVHWGKPHGMTLSYQFAYFSFEVSLSLSPS